MPPHSHPHSHTRSHHPNHLRTPTWSQIKSLYELPSASRDGSGFFPWQPPRSNSLAPAPSGALPGAGSGAAEGVAAAAAGAGPHYDLQGLEAAPWDWSLKTRVRVASPQPLACLQAAASAGLLPACRAACGAAADASSGGDGVAAALAERLQRALLQWQHPEQQLGGEVLQLMRQSKGTGELLAARARAWRDCLRGLHASVRNGQCPAAYVVGAQVRVLGINDKCVWNKRVPLCS